MNKIIASITICSVLFIGGCLSADIGTNEPKINETEVKHDIVNEYNPGTCFGMPGAVSEKRMNETISKHPSLVKYISNKYSLNNTREVYRKIEQFNQVNVSQINETHMKFTIMDGNCCTIKTINGTLNTKTGEIVETNNSTRTVPC